MSKKSESKELVDIHNKISPSTFENILKKNMEAILKNPKMSSFLPPIHCVSAPGNGKSSIVKNVADELGIKFVDFRMSTHEAVDLRGLPVPNKEVKSVEWYPTSELPRDPNFEGILLFDEIDSCSPDLQVALYEIILDRRIGDIYKVPEKCMIVACGNRSEDRAVARPMSSALANRFMHFELDNNIEDWVRWANYNNINPSVIGFLQFKPNYLFSMENQILDRGWPSPRSWAKVSAMIDLYGNNHENDNELRKIVYGLVGNRVGVEFMEYWKINANFQNVLDWMRNPNLKIEIPNEVDRKYAITSAMNYLLWRGTTDDEENVRIDGFYRISMELSPDFASMAMQSAMEGDCKANASKCCNKLFKHPKYKEWSKLHGKHLRNHF